MNDQPTSGNRWEPTAGETPAADQPTPEQPAEPVRSGLGSRFHGDGRSTGIRLGAAAVLLFVLGGAGGFGLTHLVSDDRPARSVPGQRDGSPDGEHGRGFHRGPQGTPPGHLPQEGTPGNQSGGSDDGAVGGDDT